MVPLSSRNITPRGGLSVFNQISNIMMTGILVALVFPIVIMPMIGVDQDKWITLMSALSILELPLTLLEYYFTKERVTLESRESGENVAVPFKQLDGSADSADIIPLLAMSYELTANKTRKRGKLHGTL